MARLGAAGTVDRVIAIVNEYIGSRDPRDLAALPEECRVGAMGTAEEVARYAYRLAAYHRHDDHARGIQRIAAFFSMAAVRLAELSKSPTAAPKKGPDTTSSHDQPAE